MKPIVTHIDREMYEIVIEIIAEMGGEIPPGAFSWHHDVMFVSDAILASDFLALQSIIYGAVLGYRRGIKTNTTQRAFGSNMN